MKRQNAIATVCLSALFLLVFQAFSSPAFADLAKCGCYCGEVTDPPCSDAKCKEVCKWRDGSGGSRRDRGEPVITVPDPVTERHNRALDLNREGLSALQNGNPQRAVEQLAEAVKLWPENGEIRKNLGTAEAAKKAAALAKLNADLGGQDRKDKRASDLGKDLKAQDRKDRAAGLDRALSAYDRKDAIKKSEAKIAHLRDMMKVDQQAIRRLGLYDPRDPDKRARDFEAWARLAEETQLEHEKEFMDDVLIATEGLASAALIGKTKALVPADVMNMQTKLLSLGVNDPYLFEALHKLTLTAAKTSSLHKLVQRVHVAVAAVELTAAPTATRANGFDRMEGLAAVLTVIDGKYKVLAAELRFLTSALYDNAVQRVSRRSVNSLTKLTEEQLRIVAEYNKRMKVCTEEIAREKNTLRQLAER